MLNPLLPQTLRRLLAGPLPGPGVADRYEPYREEGSHYDQPPDDARPAAVLALLYPHERQWHLPLTVRGSHLGHHAGQICLPGGAVEPGETSAEAAIREFHEELAAPKLEIELLGRLTPLYVATSDFRVDPWVAVARRRGAMQPDGHEVVRLLEVPLDHLLDPANLGRHRRQRHGRRVTVPHFAWQEYRIWGATCMILGELVALVGSLNETDRR